MDNAGYVSLSRQSGLLKELSIIANNMANSDTTGFKREGAVFSEYITAAQTDPKASNLRESLSMGQLAGHASNFSAGGLRETGGSLDVALQGDGFFLVNVNGQTALTRAGHFMTDQTGRLITPDGNAVLDVAEGEIQIPAEASLLQISKDGVLSADGVEFSRLGVVSATETDLTRLGGNNWLSEQGFEPVEFPDVLQGFLEDSNVQPLTEITRMIEVQRLYEAGQKLLEMEDDRIKQTITTIRQIS